jgi:beta-lactamase superfamily II metal-dependent hydrolase
VAPAQAFASAGHDNHFGHPAASIVARYRELGIALTVTGHSGMLIYAHGADAAPLRWRQHAAFPWRLPEPVVE